MERKIAMASGNFNFLNKRNTGSKTKLKKKDISKGMMTIFPTTTMVPIKYNPSNSRERLTVTVMVNYLKVKGTAAAMKVTKNHMNN
jgi:hypothetical protein